MTDGLHTMPLALMPYTHRVSDYIPSATDSIPSYDGFHTMPLALIPCRNKLWIWNDLDIARRAALIYLGYYKNHRIDYICLQYGGFLLFNLAFA